MKSTKYETCAYIIYSYLTNLFIYENMFVQVVQIQGYRLTLYHQEQAGPLK